MRRHSTIPGFKAAQKLVPNEALSKLMVWSFLAGFSEKFVSRMLRQVESFETAKKPDAPNPPT